MDEMEIFLQNGVTKFNFIHYLEKSFMYKTKLGTHNI